MTERYRCFRQLFQLGNVHRVGVVAPCRNTEDTAGNIAIDVTDRYRCFGRFPYLALQVQIGHAPLHGVVTAIAAADCRLAAATDGNRTALGGLRTVTDSNTVVPFGVGIRTDNDAVVPLIARTRTDGNPSFCPFEDCRSRTDSQGVRRLFINKRPDPERHRIIAKLLNKRTATERGGFLVIHFNLGAFTDGNAFGRVIVRLATDADGVRTVGQCPHTDGNPFIPLYTGAVTDSDALFVLCPGILTDSDRAVVFINM